MDDGISGIGGNAGYMDDCFGGVANLEPSGLLGRDKSGNEIGGVSQLFSEFAEINEKNVCPHCLTEIRAGYDKVCFYCEKEIKE